MKRKITLETRILIGKLSVAALLSFSLSYPAAASTLFDSDEILEFSLSGPLGSIARERKEQEQTQFPFELRIGETTLPVKVRIRGKSRKQLCPFPPLRLKFENEVAAGTPFENQTTLKLVTHCNNKDDHFENNVLDEYLAYRIFNEISEASYKVRLLRIHYTDTDGRHRDLARPFYAFVIENNNDPLSRLGGTPANLSAVQYSRLEPVQTARMSVFQFLVGNLDWSFVRNPGDDQCCHNVDLLDNGHALLPIPKDFDMTGLVNASYAKPPPSANIRNITTRVYRGYCRSSIDEVGRALDEIIAKQEIIMAVNDATPSLTDRDLSTRTKFIDDFFKKALKDREKLIRQFERECLGER